MRATTTEPIAREGWWWVVGIGLLLIASFAWEYSAVSKLIFGSLLIFAVLFFRNPERIAASDEPNAVLSPTDGKIVAIDREFEPRLMGCECLSVTIHTRLYDSHLVRAPLGGDFVGCEIEHGLFLPLSSEKAQQLNEKLRLKIVHSSTATVTVSILAGVLKTWLHPYPKAEQKVRTSQRIGFVRAEFKSVVHLPISSRLKVAVGDKVRGGETVIAFTE